MSDVLLNLRSAWNDGGIDGNKDEGDDWHTRCSDVHALRSSAIGLRSGSLAVLRRDVVDVVCFSLCSWDASDKKMLLAV